MPKITRHGGPSIAGVTEAQKAAPDEEVASSPGSSSETSSERPLTSSGQSGPGRRKPVRKTGSRSGRGTTGSSTARSTDGGQAADTSVSTDGED